MLKDQICGGLNDNHGLLQGCTHWDIALRHRDAFSQNSGGSKSRCQQEWPLLRLRDGPAPYLPELWELQEAFGILWHFLSWGNIVLVSDTFPVYICPSSRLLSKTSLLIASEPALLVLS